MAAHAESPQLTVDGRQEPRTAPLAANPRPLPSPLFDPAAFETIRGQLTIGTKP